MPSLDQKDAREFWKSYLDGSVYKIIAFLEASETWTISNNSDVEVALSKLGDTLEKTSQGFTFDLESLIAICSLVHMSQKLRIMQLADSITPGTATRMITQAESKGADDTYANFFIQRNMIFERTRILSRVLSSSRIRTVQQIYEGD